MVPQSMTQPGKQLRTIAEVRADFDRRGLTIREWSRRNGLCDRIVREVLRGRFQGKYGAAHKAAVLLGLKDGVVE